MNILNRDALLTKQKLEIERIDLGDDEFVFVRQMTGRERDTFEQSLIEEYKDEKGVVAFKTTTKDFRAKLAVVTLCDEDGNSLLKPTDFTVLSQNMSAARLELIVDVAQQLNKVTEVAKEVIVKNLDAVPDGNSSLDFAGN